LSTGTVREKVFMGGGLRPLVPREKLQQRANSKLDREEEKRVLGKGKKNIEEGKKRSIHHIYGAVKKEHGIRSIFWRRKMM